MIYEPSSIFWDFLRYFFFHRTEIQSWTDSRLVFLFRFSSTFILLLFLLDKFNSRWCHMNENINSEWEFTKQTIFKLNAPQTTCQWKSNERMKNWALILKFKSRSSNGLPDNWYRTRKPSDPKAKNEQPQKLMVNSAPTQVFVSCHIDWSNPKKKKNKTKWNAWHIYQVELLNSKFSIWSYRKVLCRTVGRMTFSVFVEIRSFLDTNYALFTLEHRWDCHY